MQNSNTPFHPPRPCPRRRSGQAGFSLIELLVVLSILGMIAGLVGPSVMRSLSGAKADAAKVQVETLMGAVDMFMLDVGRYPTDAEGLKALVDAPASADGWNGPYLSQDTVPDDPWGTAYGYRRRNGGFEIYTLGSDQAEGGRGDAADIRRSSAQAAGPNA